MFDPVNDGKTHINIYSRGKTVLGRLLSNWSPRPSGYSIPTEDGEFYTIEGYWAWLCFPEDWLASANGYDAKKHIQAHKEDRRHVPDFEDKIRLALTAKVCNEPYLIGGLRDSRLPLTHYYVYGGKAVDAGHGWIVEHLEDLRQKIKEKF